MKYKSVLFENQKLYINFLIGLGLITIPILSSPHIGQGLELFNVVPFQRNFISHILLAIFFFSSYYLIIPKFYVKKRWLFLSITLLISYLIVIKFPQYLINDSMHMDFGNHPPPHSEKTNPKINNNHFLSFFLSRENHIIQFLGIFILSLFLRVNEDLNTAKQEKLATEISYLRAQINPHFLFNTLNSLYALVLTKSGKAPTALIKLSALVRYMVSESNKTKIALQQEVNYIKNFIDLQKLRLTEKTKVITAYNGDFKHQEISPLLLIALIENAFKHGVDVDNDSEIILNLTIKENTLSLNIKNTIIKQQKQISTKNGILNTQEQLKRIYPNKHILKINKTKDYFNVILEIQLK